VEVDDDARRLAYCVISGARPTLRHHSASFQVFPLGDQPSHLVRVTDVLPNDVAGLTRARTDVGAVEMNRVLEQPAPDEADRPAPPDPITQRRPSRRVQFARQHRLRFQILLRYGGDRGGDQSGSGAVPGHRRGPCPPRHHR